VDVNGHLLRSFTDVSMPYHLSVDDRGEIMVADHFNDRILLLDTELEISHVLIDNSQVKLWRPTRLCYNVLTSQLYVLTWSGEVSFCPDTISLFSL